MESADQKGRSVCAKGSLISRKPKTPHFKLKQMSLFCPDKGLNCLMFSPFYRFGHPGLQQNNIVASPVALTLSVATCWVVALPYLVTSATSARKLCGIFISLRIYDDLFGDLNHWINTLLTPVDQHKLDPWS